MNRTEYIVSKGDKEAMERQRLSVATSSTAINQLKECIEDEMLSNGKTEEEVQEWSKEVDDLLTEADECIRHITNELKRVELAAQEDFVKLEQQQKLRFERELTEQRVLQKKRDRCRKAETRF